MEHNCGFTCWWPLARTAPLVTRVHSLCSPHQGTASSQGPAVQYHPSSPTHPFLPIQPYAPCTTAQTPPCTHPSPPYCMHPPVLTPHYGAPTFHSAPPVLPAPVPCALPPMHAQAQQHTGRYILSALLQAQRVLLRPRV